MQNTEIINIDEEKASKAKLLASGMSQPLIRKRGMIDMLGIGCAVSYFQSNKIRVSTKRSVHKIPLLFEEFKITDIYYNNYRIDVITLYKEKTVKIPKIHVDLDIMPHYYFIIQIGSKIKEAKPIGFLDSKSIPSCSHDSKFYYPTLDLLFDIRKFINNTRYSIPSKPLLGKHTECMGLFLKFMDRDLSSAYKKQLIQHLMNCDSCRERFIEVMEFDKLSKNIEYYPGLAKRAQEAILAKEAKEEEAKISFEARLEKEVKKEEVEAPIEPEVQIQTQIQEQKADEPQAIEENDRQSQADKNKEAIHQVLEESELIQKPIELTNSPVELKQKSKKIIDSIFNDMPKLELSALSGIMDAKNKRKAMIAVATFFVFLSFVIISVSGADTAINDEIASNQEQSMEELEGMNQDNSYLDLLPPPTGEARLIPKERKIDDFTIDAPRISESAYTPTITKVTWEAPQSLVKKEEYSKYLQLIGKNIKLNLQNDLLLVNDIPMNKTVKTDIKVSSNGEVHSINITRSSGSDAIDSRIEKTVNETMTYMKPPTHGLISRPADITLTIDFH